jgi:hypothetical protein
LAGASACTECAPGTYTNETGAENERYADMLRERRSEKERAPVTSAHWHGRRHFASGLCPVSCWIVLQRHRYGCKQLEQI